MVKSGIYIVTLKNKDLISVNANDPRISDKCIRVNFLNCKVGRMKELARGAHRYSKVFGKENVAFKPLAVVFDARRAEKIVLKVLDPWRMRGRTNRKNEWLSGITPEEAELYALTALRESGIPFERVEAR